MSTLGNLLKSGLSGQTDSVQAHLNIVKALSNYISGYVTTSGMFSGALVSPPNTPITNIPSQNIIDPTTLGTVTISCSPDPSGGGGSAQWITWMTSLYTAIRTFCFISTGPALPVGTIPAFQNLITPSWSQSDLNGVLDSDDPFSESMEIMASGIIKDLKAGFTPTFPSTYSAGAYLGNVAVTSLNCQ